MFFFKSFSAPSSLPSFPTRRSSDLIMVGMIISIILSRQLTILSLNEEVAIGLGQKIVLTKTVLFIVIIMLAGTAVALVGNIAFIGLMIPHLVRAVVGIANRAQYH